MTTKKQTRKTTHRRRMIKTAILGDIKTIQKKQKMASRLIQEDPFDYEETDAIPPIYNPATLASYMEKSSEHADAVNLKADNITSEVLIVPIEGQETESKREGDESLESERQRVKDKLDEINPDMSTTELCRRIALDWESTGSGYKEILRYENKDYEIAQWNHAPATEMRVRYNGVGFVQISGDTYRYFKRFGDYKLPMSYRTGKIDLSAQEIQDYFFDNHNIDLSDKRATYLEARQGTYREQDMATEIFDFQKYHPASPHYGLPDCISCLMAMELVEKSEEYNYFFFANHAMARWAIIVKGPEDAIPEELQGLLADYINAATKGNSNVGKSIFIPIPPNVEIDFKKLDADIKEGSFLKLNYESSVRIARSERVPLELLQIITPQGIGGGEKLKYALEQFKMFVIGRGQEYFAHRINKNLIWSEKGLNIKNWQIKFKDFDITNIAEDTETFAKIDKVQSLGYKEKRAFGQRLGIIADVELDEDDMILVPTNVQPMAYLQPEKEEETGVKKSPEAQMLKGFHELKTGILRQNAERTEDVLHEELETVEVE